MIGSVVDGRFEVGVVAGKGGMGTVFRARDRETGAPVALKLVEGVHANNRFLREASLLAELAHDGIVRYVAHGTLAENGMFLAMEWLEGIPLDERIARGPLSVSEVMALGTRLAGALGEAHARGIVHRDVKPSNVMLRDGKPELATLVDFGIARSGAPSKAMTATGAVIGTPAYMAPEQVRGERTVDARADVFALGCVLFECLAGRPAFAGEHVIAVLAKILLEPAPRVRSLRSDVAPSLDALLASMLEKSAELRPEDGHVIERALRTLDESAPGVGPRIGETERRLATVVMARPNAKRSVAFAATEDALSGLTEESVVARATSQGSMSLASLADGTIVGAVVAGDSGKDAAHRAVKCALVLERELGRASIAVATGRAVVAGDLPVGEAIDAAARMLREDAVGLFIDEATASLVEGRFDLARATNGITVVSEGARARTVLGREIPCFGRDRELGLLEATYAECVDEPIARAVLIIAPPGIGKSRLQRELVKRLGRRDEAAPQVWLGLVDPLMQGAPYALAGDLFRRVLGIAEGIPIVERRARLASQLAEVLGADRDRMVRFLGEIVDAPVEEDDDVLRAARRNPSLMAAQIGAAVGDFAVHALARSPILLVLEDVHWADVPSLRLVEAMLSRAKDLPLFVIALARPTVDEVHPKLWEQHRCQRIILDPLLKKAAEKLARAVLGEDASVEALVQRAQGNALFVEELARAKARGASSDLPPTIAAAAEARLSTLDPDARQALRAASVFGERFWHGAVAHLVGPRVAATLDKHLEAIEEGEFALRATQSRFAGEREYVFAHALVRDAAYAMLIDADRALGHALAGEWLASRVDDAALLAQHFEAGERPERAASFYVRAAQQALAADELETVLAHVARAESLGVAGEDLGDARLAEAEARLFRGDNPRALGAGREGLDLVPRPSERWFVGIGVTVAAAGKLGNVAELSSLVDRLESVPATDEAEGRARAIARVRAAMQLAWCGFIERAHRLLDGCAKEPGAANDLALEAWYLDASFELAFASGNPMHPAEPRRAKAIYAKLGDRRGVFTQTGAEIMTLLALGAIDEACVLIDELVVQSGPSAPAFMTYSQSMAHAWRAAMKDGNYDGLLDLIQNPFMVSNVRAVVANKIWLAAVLLNEREDDALALVEEAIGPSETSPSFHTVALAILARLRHRRGNLVEALELATRAFESAKRGVAVWGACLVDCAYIEVLEASGRKVEAKRALDDAIARLDRRIERVGEYGPRYLEKGLNVQDLLALRARLEGATRPKDAR